MMPDGRLNKEFATPALEMDGDTPQAYVLVPGDSSDPSNPSNPFVHPDLPDTQGAVTFLQKDIRAVQLGKSALITGIEFLGRAAGIDLPSKILIAGAFGSHLKKEDMLALGMLPAIEPDRIESIGNAAGTGAIMALCDEKTREKIEAIAADVTVVDLALSPEFQDQFIKSLGFPEPV